MVQASDEVFMLRQDGLSVCQPMTAILVDGLGSPFQTYLLPLR